MIRNAKLHDLDNLTRMEAVSYPEAEGASRESIKGRLETFPNHFWILEEDGRMLAFINGLVTNEKDLTDEMYDHPKMHDENGRWQMIFSVVTAPEYRRRGYAGQVMRKVIEDAKRQKREGVVLTCKEELIPFYSRFGFVNEGISGSTHGNVTWYQMRLTLKRGSAVSDEKEFSASSIEILKKAAGHIRYLVNEGYAIKNASVFVGNHFLLSERQRLALVRSISGDEQLRIRREKECTAEELYGQTVSLDGFNTIITLEIALCQSLLLQCMDGTVRDLAGLRGTYRLIEETPQAVQIIGDALEHLKVRKAVFYLDAPVSNSGRLKSLIADVWEAYDMELDIQVINDVDRILQEKAHVITGDAIILDKCKSWFNLAALCVEKTEAVPVKVW